MSATITNNKEFSEKQLKEAQSAKFTIVDQTTLCVECLDHRAALKCLQCDDQYCDLCFAQLHRFGFRALHNFEMLPGLDINSAHLNDFALPNQTNDTTIATSKMTTTTTTTTTNKPLVSSQGLSVEQLANITSVNEIPDNLGAAMIIYPAMDYRLRYIPLRLNDYERKLLHILESALNISEYTDKTDVLQLRNRDSVIIEQISNIYHIISALYLSGEYKKGVRKFLTDGKNTYHHNRKFFQHVFEIGRRHKIRNPDKLRSGYGKLMAICGDSKMVRSTFGFELAVPIRSVTDRCKQWGIVDMLTDDLLPLATCQIDVQSCTDKNLLHQALELRNYTAKTLCTRYSAIATQYLNDNNIESPWEDDEITKTKKISPDDINLLIASISDAHNYLYQCFTPLDRMSKRLERHFAPGKQVLPIDIRNGVEGSRLSHSTDEQYMYIKQTFFLWRTIMLRMYPLWYSADSDQLCGYTTFQNGVEMSNPISYQLRFTEQGITRMQSCPSVGRIMSDIMSSCFRHFNNNWVGSSAVHLGDTNVPNSLSFIDKYTQLERILAPLDRTLYQIETAWKSGMPAAPAGSSSTTMGMGGDDSDDDDEEEDVQLQQQGPQQQEKPEPHPLLSYFQQYYSVLGSSNPAPPHFRIMQDYFRHAFNGSGADNYNSAGSCIDGRLTSSWEWCNVIGKKEYHQAFLITGFIGWDG